MAKYDKINTGKWNDFNGKRFWSVLSGDWDIAELTGEVDMAKLTGEYQWKEFIGEGWLPKASQDEKKKKDWWEF
jgi:hypothetical protein